MRCHSILRKNLISLYICELKTLIDPKNREAEDRQFPFID